MAFKKSKMKVFEFKNDYYKYCLYVKENGQVCHGNFLPTNTIAADNDCDFPFEALININNEELDAPHGDRYIYSESVKRSRFEKFNSVKIENGADNIVTVFDEDSGMKYHLHYLVRENSPAIQRYCVAENCGNYTITLNHISSAVLSGFPYSKKDDENSIYVHSISSAWCYEGEHHRESFASLRVYKYGLTGYTKSAAAGWPCQNNQPYFVIEQEKTNLFTAIQIESTSSWRFEIGNETFYDPNHFYIQAGLGNEYSADWNRELNPGEFFVTPTVSIAVSNVSFEDVTNLMHLHQSVALINRSLGDRKLPIIFNDWLSMQGNVYEEIIEKSLDRLKEAGVECYVTDAGWFTESKGKKADWNEMVGYWICNSERFPNGIKGYVEKVNSRGMIAGIWCEIEAVGKNVPIYNDKEMLLMKNGNFITNNGRRFLNFTSKKTISYATEVFDMFADCGIGYVKIDFNADPGPSADNCGTKYGGDGVHRNRIAYGEWLKNIRKKHPGMIIESCSSGGMRLEYNSLSMADIASLTDQSKYEIIGKIAYNVTRTIHPSQCGIWIPSDYLKGNKDAFISSLCGAMVGRFHLSGSLCFENSEFRSITKEATEFYKSFRHIIEKCTVDHCSGELYYYEGEKPYAIGIISENRDEAVYILQNVNCGNTGVVYLNKLVNGKYTVRTFPSTKLKNITIDDGFDLNQLNINGSSSIAFYLKKAK